MRIVAERIRCRTEREKDLRISLVNGDGEAPREVGNLICAPAHPLFVVRIVWRLRAAVLGHVDATRVIVVAHLNPRPAEMVVQLHTVDIVILRRVDDDACEKFLRIGMKWVEPDESIMRKALAVNVAADPIVLPQKL